MEQQACTWGQAWYCILRRCAQKLERGQLSDWIPWLVLTLQVTVASDLCYNGLQQRASGRKEKSLIAITQFKFLHLLLEGCDIPTRAGSCRARRRQLSDRGRDFETLVPLARRLLLVHSSSDASAPQCRHVHPPEGDGCLLLHLILIRKAPAT